MEKYKATIYFRGEITKHEIVKETEKRLTFVTYTHDKVRLERNELKRSNYHKWFDTFEEATAWLIEREKKIIQIAEKSIINARAQIEKYKQMKPL